MGIFLAWIVFSIVAALIGAQRGRSGWGFFFLSMLLSPLIGIILAVALPDLAAARMREQEREAEHQLQRELAHKSASSPMSVADELEKLMSLKDRGALSTDEFNAEKARLLKGSAAASTFSGELNTAADCKAVLAARGYRAVGAAEGPFDVREPSGGTANIADLERLILYTNSRKSLPKI